MSTKFYAVTGGAKGALLLTLDRDMVWVNELSYKKIIATPSETSDMGKWVNEESLVSDAGRNIRLEARDGWGYQTKTTAAALKTLFDVVNFRAFIEIISNSITVTKKVRCVHEGDGIDFTPAYDRSGHLLGSDYYEGIAEFEIVS